MTGPEHSDGEVGSALHISQSSPDGISIIMRFAEGSLLNNTDLSLVLRRLSAASGRYRSRYCEVAGALVSPVPGEAQQKEEQVDKVQIK